MSDPPTGSSTPPYNNAPFVTSHLSSVSNLANSLYRRLTDQSASTSTRSRSRSTQRSIPHQQQQQQHPPPPTPPGADMPNGIYTPPHRHASPFQPPPLTPLALSGDGPDTDVLSRAIAEEIRLLVPGRLQLAETWNLIYSLERDGVSLGTLYHKCASPKLEKGCGFVLVVQDASGGIFGAYLTDPPKPIPSSYYGTGECFLWRASISSLLANLPPPPSAANTEQIGRSTTVNVAGDHQTLRRMSSPRSSLSNGSAGGALGHLRQNLTPPQQQQQNHPQAMESIRFKAFPYSGINDYLIHCEQNFLSVGGGDGKYGLWLDGVLERGVSSAGCLTFGNEALSDDGEKFEVVGVEIWAIGAG